MLTISEIIRARELQQALTNQPSFSVAPSKRSIWKKFTVAILEPATLELVVGAKCAQDALDYCGSRFQGRLCQITQEVAMEDCSEHEQSLMAEDGVEEDTWAILFKTSNKEPDMSKRPGLCKSIASVAKNYPKFVVRTYKDLALCTLVSVAKGTVNGFEHFFDTFQKASIDRIEKLGNDIEKDLSCPLV